MYISQGTDCELKKRVDIFKGLDIIKDRTALIQKKTYT